ncbi:MAG: hypothetical protein LBL08_03200 [Candidatus Nomurabacteria bacterium]|jgi:hypothetical protein|nr:hypothetical protein [Candidatus Nomurabacteria bacterium]
MTVGNKTTPVGESSLSAEKIMLKTFVSANLRILLPVLGLFGIGVLVDFLTDSGMFWTIIGLSVGVVISTTLVVLQLKNIRKAQK